MQFTDSCVCHASGVFKLLRYSYALICCANVNVTVFSREKELRVITIITMKAKEKLFMWCK